MKINIFWFRRDLRLDDNTALIQALSSGIPVLPLFIFDVNITDELPKDDPRITFIYDTLSGINNNLKRSGSSIYIVRGDPEKIWKELIHLFDINAVYINKDYETYSIQRDRKIKDLLGKYGIPLLMFKDQVIFEEDEILKQDNNSYTVFTPYKNRWIKTLSERPQLKSGNNDSENQNFIIADYEFPPLDKINFKLSKLKVKAFTLSVIKEYDKFRDYPALDKTSYLGPHLRFGTVSIRKLVNIALQENPVFLSELIWREFFMQILFSFPHVITGNFKSKFDNIQWRNNEKEFDRWCVGETGYPVVDAGMRQLNETGYMHNRVRMITAGFLCKHLLIDWRWGEAYFASKLLDYELSSNNGNWQWAAGTGCDAAPYFRIFNPSTQQKKFDPQNKYIKKWAGDSVKPFITDPVVDHDYARKRAIEAYQTGIKRGLK